MGLRFPIFVAMGAEPVPALVMPFLGIAHGDAASRVNGGRGGRVMTKSGNMRLRSIDGVRQPASQAGE